MAGISATKGINVKLGQGKGRQTNSAILKHRQDGERDKIYYYESIQREVKEGR